MPEAEPTITPPRLLRRAARAPGGHPARHRRLMVRLLALAFMVAPTLVLAWVGVVDSERGHDAAIVAICLFGMTIGTALYLMPPAKVPDWALGVAVAGSTVLLSAVIFFAGASDAGLGLLYVWATPYAYFLFGARHALLQTALVAVCFAGALAIRPGIPGALGNQVASQEPVRWLLVVATVTIVGVLVRRLADSLAESHTWFQRGFEDSPLGLALVAVDDLRILEVNAAFAAMLGRRRADMTGRTIIELTEPVDREISYDARAAGLAAREATWSFEKRYLHADGTAVPVRINISMVRAATGTPECFFAQVEDITERRLHEAELARHARQQQAVAMLGQSALQDRDDLAELMGQVVHCLAETLEVELAAVLELDAEAQTVRFVSGVGWDEEVAAGAEFSVAEPDTQCAYTLASRQPVVVADLATDERFSASPYLRDRGGVSGMSVVIEGAGEPFGVLTAQSALRREFTDDDTHFLQAVAHVLSSAVIRHRAERATRHAALHDELTGLPNRRLALDRITQALRRRDRTRDSVAVLMIDLDRFKIINDSLGHAAGDQLLLGLSPRLKEAVRPGDTIARLGGDEFVVVCEGLDGPREAVAVAERLARTVSEPVMLDDGEHHVSASIGIAVARVPHVTADSLLRDADAAMYLAKERGRGRYELFDDSMREQVIRRMRTENELRRALDAGELEVHYQPILDLRLRRPIGMEALVRWQHPERGLLAPGEFIAVAEDSGLIGELGRRVLEDACRQTARWQRQFDTPVGVCVNVSGRQIAQPAFARQVADIVAASGLRAGTLGLEITESVLIDEAAAPMTVLSALREHDLRLVLDDFGTGYSSLGCLQRFPIDGIKIDRGFVASLGRDRDGSAIVQAIVRMAQALELDVVAEGIETADQAQGLTALECTHGQGFLFARPMRADAMTEYLAGHPPVSAWRRRAPVVGVSAPPAR